MHSALASWGDKSSKLKQNLRFTIKLIGNIWMYNILFLPFGGELYNNFLKILKYYGSYAKSMVLAHSPNKAQDEPFQ